MAEGSLEQFIPDEAPVLRLIPGESAHVWDDSWIMRNLPEVIDDSQVELVDEVAQATGNLIVKKIRKEWS